MFGPIGAPIVIGFIVALIIVASSTVATVSFNFAVCFGINYASGLMGHEWVYLLGTFIAAAITAAMYFAAPPHHASNFKYVPPLLQGLKED